MVLDECVGVWGVISSAGTKSFEGASRSQGSRLVAGVSAGDEGRRERAMNGERGGEARGWAVPRLPQCGPLWEAVAVSTGGARGERVGPIVQGRPIWREQLWSDCV